jgi:hypothetical protein
MVDYRAGISYDKRLHVTEGNEWINLVFHLFSTFLGTGLRGFMWLYVAFA